MEIRRLFEMNNQMTDAPKNTRIWFSNRSCFAGVVLAAILILFPIYGEAGESVGEQNAKGGENKCWTLDTNHSLFTALLKKHVKNGRVNYRALKGNSAGLEKYLATLESVCKADFSALKKKEKLAFFINAYNAYTLKLVVQHYPTKSIRDIGNGGDWAWKSAQVHLKNLFGKSVSLHHLENHVIRPRFKEPRIHFALNCASKGCPPLLAEAFTGKKLYHQLNRVTKGFMKDSSINQYDPKTNTVQLSKIFEWYKEDFGGESKLLDYFTTYAPPATAEAVQGVIAAGKSPSLEFTKYDWRLNQ